MRMEDLDPQRSKTEFAQAALDDLRWLGISWDEGPDIGGQFAPYEQSRRKELYRTSFELLRARGWLYPCSCSRKELARMAQAPHEAGDRAQEAVEDEPLYPGTCRPRGASQSGFETGSPLADQNWRFRVPDGENIDFIDEHFGPQRFIAGKDFGDFLVWRRDDVPSYQLAVVTDDAAMQITEVVRGADLLKSTARQILLYRALGLAEPRWYHCPLVVDEQGQRLAKRHDAMSLKRLREAGVRPEELLNRPIEG